MQSYLIVMRCEALIVDRTVGLAMKWWSSTKEQKMEQNGLAIATSAVRGRNVARTPMNIFSNLLMCGFLLFSVKFAISLLLFSLP